VHGATIENTIGHISASHFGRARFAACPARRMAMRRLLVASSTDEGSGKRPERAQELALHTFNDPKVANGAIPLA